MVSFTCNECGGSIKKAVVEKHFAYQCPKSRCVNITCIDCLQDFYADTYQAHVKCLTENEKYGAKGTVERSNNKGEMKQQDWVSMINEIYESHQLDSKHKQLLEHVRNCDNIPRKKRPFVNFMKNSVRQFCKNEALIESLYDLLSKEFLAKNSSSKTSGADSVSNGSVLNVKEANDCDKTDIIGTEVTPDKKKKKRNKHKSESRESEPSTLEEIDENQDNLESNENEPPQSDKPESEEKTHLSKKERKEKKKREKYLSELNEIEHYEQPEEVVGAVENEETGKKKKDKKHRHKSESSSVEESAVKTHAEETNGVEEASNTVPLERKLSKKEKKRKISENTAAEGESKKKHKNIKNTDDLPLKEKTKEVCEDENEEFIKPDKFKIDKVVRIILQSQGGELAMKRLAKRVITEYQIRCGVQDSDYIMAKFQKKIFKIPGVKIIKDKAVLV